MIAGYIPYTTEIGGARQCPAGNKSELLRRYHFLPYQFIFLVEMIELRRLAKTGGSDYVFLDRSDTTQGCALFKFTAPLLQGRVPNRLHLPALEIASQKNSGGTAEGVQKRGDSPARVR